MLAGVAVDAWSYALLGLAAAILAALFVLVVLLVVRQPAVP